ncbi:methyltransferase domain-containing protein [Nostoc sp.]|uniref:methyltransferase domain-containing protein n=1 Tax=Nostoc sp. TaxID=1180 RepID=UPI002FF9B092
MLTQEQIQECQSNFNLSYHVNFAHICQELVGLENKDVLEVGGSLPPNFVFDYLGVKSWTGIETPDYEKSLQETGGITHTGTIIKDIKNISDYKFNKKPQNRYNFYLENIEDLPEEYYNKYDLIFSIATFEHIHKLPLALDKMFLALKPGGKLFSMFSPIWSAYDGHHLPNLVDQQGRKFHFGDSPITPWGHLLMSPPEMYSHLCQFTDIETANVMVYYIYHSPHINRLFTEDYLAYINQSFFTTDKINLVFIHPIELEIKSKLEQLYPGRKCFQNNGMLLIASKQEDKQLIKLDQQKLDNKNKEIDTMNNSNSSTSSKVIRVDLGCGTHKEEGFIGVDVIAGDQVDVIADLNGHFPFPDNSVGFIKAHDIIEHLPDRIHTMNEIWRICKPDAIVYISVPSTDGRGAFQDPTHVSFWNLNSFMYYCQEFPPYLAGCQSHYGFKGEFSIVSIEEKHSALQIIHVHAVLKVIKPEDKSYQLNLRNINLIIFPNWNQSIDIIFEELVNLCQAIIDNPNSTEISLIIDTQNINLEDAQFFLADVLMNLCSNENIDDDNFPELNLVRINSPEEYKGLLPVLCSRIILENENEEFIIQMELEKFSSCRLEELNEIIINSIPNKNFT